MDSPELKLLLSLPEPVRRKVVALHDVAEAAAGASRQASDRHRDAQQAARRAADRLRALANWSGTRNADWSAKRDAAAADAQAAAAEAKRLAGVYDTAASVFQQRGNLSTRIRHFLEDMKGGLVTLVPSPDVRLKKGETHAEAIETARAEIAALRAEIRRAGRAPVTGKEARDRAEAYCKRLTEAGVPDVDCFFRSAQDGAPGWPTRRFSVSDAHGALKTQNVTTTDPIALLAWMFPTEFTDAVLRAVADVDDDPQDQIALADRPSMLADLATRLEAAERVEERLVELAGEIGLDIARRPDCRVECVLGIAFDGLAQEAAA